MKLDHKFTALEAEVSEDGALEGYASRFGVKDQGGDIVTKGAFLNSLSERRPKMLWQHNPAQPIGKWTDVKEDSTGLLVRGQLNMEVQKGREARALIKDGAMDGLSIGYKSQKVKKTKAGRELKELDLWEISLVTFPMLQEAQVSSVKSLDDIDASNPVELKRFVEKMMREARFTTDEAKAAAAAVAKVRAEREVMTEEDESKMLSELTQVIRGLG